jgi:Effector-associated domain 11/CHAT domain
VTENKYLVNVKGLIANNRLSDAITELVKLVEGRAEYESFANEIVIISSRYSKLSNEKRVGILSNSEENVIRSQLAFSLIKLIDEISSFEIETHNKIFPDDKISNVGNKNIVLDSEITASGQIHIGDIYTINVGDTQVEPNTIEQLIESQNKIKVLFIASNPRDTSRLRLEKEMREIDLELSRAKYREKFEFKKYMEARLDDLLNILLEDTPHFIHFAGHGTDEGIALMDDKTENSHIVKGKNLAKLFKLFSNDIACVFLNSCYSKSQGKEIIKFIPNVIGMKKGVPDKTAIVFAKSFYKSIGAGKEIDFAFEFAKVSIGLYNESGEEIPEHLNKQNAIN